MYKNIDKEKVLVLKDLVEYQSGQVISKTLVQNDLVSITVFSFDKNEEIATHKTAGDALVTILDGTAKIIIGDNSYILTSNQSIVMPKDIPHALFAEEKFKMILTVSY